ncbi:oncoprotein-induced transcript 3 protein-like [Diadema setosum]|uniref:oncoprotein-induced transcript 3 protein-like n=1 Tax=Diadema setosum TaxID=31175 RepID=UPI003B3BE5A8
MARSVTLADDACQGQIYGSELIVLTALYGDCGMKVEDRGDYVVFSNNLRYTKRPHRQYYLDVPVQCMLHSRQHIKGTESYEVELDKRNNSWSVRGFASFSLTLDRYPNDHFRAPSSQRESRVPLNDRLYYGVTLDSATNVTLRLQRCWATPDGNTNNVLSYGLIDEGCPEDTTLKLYTDLGRSMVGFSFKAFAFRGSHPQTYSVSG